MKIYVCKRYIVGQRERLSSSGTNLTKYSLGTYKSCTPIANLCYTCDIHPTNKALLTLGAHAQRGLQYLGLCVCLLSHISPTEGLFVLKTLSRTQRATKVKKFVGICLKRLRSRVMPRNMSEKAKMLIIQTYPWSAFSA